MSTSPGVGLVPLPLPPTILARLPPCPPAGDEPRLHLGKDAGLDDLRAALQNEGADGDVQRELRKLLEAQAARDGPITRSAGDGGEEGADESYAGPGADTDAGAGASTAESINGGGTKRNREASSGDGPGDAQNSDDDEDEEEEGLLAYHPDATVILRNSYSEADDGGDDGKGASTKGHLFVTTRRILFLSATDAIHNAAIDAGCVVLHALSECEERGWHVYCQLDDGSAGSGGDDENSVPDEAYFYPSSNQSLEGAEGGQKDACQNLFDAFTALASLNPIYGDDNDNVGSGGGGGFFGMMAGMGGIMMGSDGGENDDDMVCRLGEGINPSGGLGPTTDANGDDGATEEERAAMLERLDGMLVVPAEYEIASGEEDENENKQGGQFDDAEEESGDDIL